MELARKNEVDIEALEFTRKKNPEVESDHSACTQKIQELQIALHEKNTKLVEFRSEIDLLLSSLHSIQSYNVPLKS